MKFYITLITGLLFCASAIAGFRAYDGDTDLDIFNTIKCSTGLTCSKEGGKMKMVSSPSLTGPLTLEDDEEINNTVDDTVEIISNDEHTTLKITGFEAKDAILEMAADEEDDTADLYYLKSNASNVFSVGNGSTELATLSTAGDWVFKGTTPYLTVGDGDEEDAGLVFDGDAQDYNISLDDTADDLVIGLGSAGGTTDAIRIDENQDVTIVQDLLPLSTITGDGGAALVGMLQNQIASSATSLTLAQCGSTIIGGGVHQMELPEASTALGCRYTFVLGGSDALTINPDDADQILLITNAAGDAMTANVAGESITIEAISASEWAPIGAEQGTWDDAD